MKGACTVLNEGKGGDNFKVLPIVTIRKGEGGNEKYSANVSNY